jgi:hypothetical protein
LILNVDVGGWIMNTRKLVALVVLACLPLLGGELPPEVQVKFVKILCASAGSPGKVACKDPDLIAELGKVGLTNDPDCKVAWAATTADIKSLKAAGKLVICGRLEDIAAGGAIAVIEEGGKAVIYLSMSHITGSGVRLTDSVLKIGKRI